MKSNRKRFCVYRRNLGVAITVIWSKHCILSFPDVFKAEQQIATDHRAAYAVSRVKMLGKKHLIDPQMT